MWSSYNNQADKSSQLLACKTTLAKHVYEDSLTVHHFDLRAWATISQDYDVRDILWQLLSVAEGTLDELREQLHKKLFGRRYLIVLDDVWDMEVLDSINRFFPDNVNGSRIILTTRLSNIATQLRSICFRINFLDEDTSWKLFCKKIFGHQYCPVDLEGIGKEIVKQCKGLPLSIVVIGGILRKSSRTKEYWQNIAQNMNEIFNSTENGQCLDVLYLSYSHLPAHLKPCFLYLGTFREDSKIRVSEIINLWVAEGFLKPNDEKDLEEMAEDCLKDLIDRNLILVCGHHSNGRIKSFCIHDLLRELCLKVADKEEFFYVVGEDSIPQDLDRKRRLIFFYRNSFKVVQSASLARSLIFHEQMKPVKCRLLRVYNYTNHQYEVVFQNQNVNQRYVGCWLSKLPSSISLIWNLQTLVIKAGYHIINAPLDIWKMTQLRHLKCTRICLPDPPPSDDKDDSVVFRNLQTLSHVYNFTLSEEVCKRIPNIRKLCVMRDFPYRCDNGSFDNLSNLGHLQRLESAYLAIFSHEFSISKLKDAFPGSLKKLVFNWQIPVSEEMWRIIGSLPQLVVLKLRRGYSSRQLQKWSWSCVEGGFLRLKYLSIMLCPLESWTLDGASCFPVLEKLVLIDLHDLDEIPSGIGEIPTLQLIRLESCRESLVISPMKIKEEQKSFGNDGLQIQVKTFFNKGDKLTERVKAEGLSIEDIHLESH